MRILFCNIAWMKEYRGNEDGKDTPLNGGSYVWDSSRQNHIMVKMSIKCELRILRGVSY